MRKTKHPRIQIGLVLLSLLLNGRGRGGEVHLPVQEFAKRAGVPIKYDPVQYRERLGERVVVKFKPDPSSKRMLFAVVPGDETTDAAYRKFEKIQFREKLKDLPAGRYLLVRYSPLENAWFLPMWFSKESQRFSNRPPENTQDYLNYCMENAHIKDPLISNEVSLTF